MSSQVSRTDTGVGVSFIASAVIHLAVFLLFAWWGRQFPTAPVIQETYYVDVVTLPTVAPQAGSTINNPGKTKAASLPAPTLPMAVPRPPKTVPKTGTQSIKTASPQDAAETEAAFAERMAKLEKNSEARREEAVLEKLRSKVKVASASKTGMPGAGGADAGSRYADYVRSRLEDALKVTSSYTTKNPEVAVRLTIAADGRLARIKIERSSGDAAFELAVRRAIDLASEKFTAPPNHTTFDNGFIFKPKGISSGKPR